jgi:pyruvate/2-oxoglutarate dehydrogenase complex dihydrolipoamide dehydrogenase (E3) component
MPQRSAPKDIEKMVYETARAMARARNGVSTPRVVKLYIDDAREVLLGVATAAKRQGWTADELVLALDQPKPKLKPWERDQGPLPSSSET